MFRGLYQSFNPLGCIGGRLRRSTKGAIRSDPNRIKKFLSKISIFTTGANLFSENFVEQLDQSRTE